MYLEYNPSLIKTNALINKEYHKLSSLEMLGLLFRGICKP